MQDTKFPNAHDDVRGPRGKAVGFLESAADAETLKDLLLDHGIDASHMEFFTDAQSLPQWEELMGGETWGEQAETCLSQGKIILERGGAAFAVQVADRHEAEDIARIANSLGVISVMYFGQLVDIVLMA